MIDSLHIENFRSLKRFQIDSLKRVNLIAGKNNTGKSSLLEAVALYACKGKMNDVLRLLENRGEYSPATNVPDFTEFNIRSLSRLFADGKIEYGSGSAIRIGDRDSSVRLRFVKYLYNPQTNAPERVLPDNENNPNAKTGFEIRCDGSFLIQLDMPVSRFENVIVPDRYKFVGATDVHGGANDKLFDGITLTERESSVIDALRIIEPRVERIAFVADRYSAMRNPVVKLSGLRDVSPMSGMGDGINRILTIILALVNVENGYLLIDEFENGLHYKVQERLWNVIFKTAKELNAQVFATTHSNDCIRSFGNVLNNPDYDADDGKLIRLDRKDDTVSRTEFDARELRIANVRSIEIR
ncbi:MAG: AAA family ATPase [Prevotellaceae bacterium]|jgi:hypothetical protein|nr:AAA family ATPase [Prevotellaceae bacterium]